MSTKTLRNITIAQFQAFLDLALCTRIDINSGHEKWTRADLRRPIIFQTHINPIPEFIIQNNLRGLGYTKKQFFEILESKVEVKRNRNNFSLEKVKK
ncbi:MAG: type II toxin-antitoxin system HicA family toxin [Flavobacteriia bacterium]|nr:type II toxin-antitoxin system HicA family toxin [Flavobacteriia bacterium]